MFCLIINATPTKAYVIVVIIVIIMLVLTRMRRQLIKSIDCDILRGCGDEKDVVPCRCSCNDACAAGAFIDVMSMMTPNESPVLVGLTLATSPLLVTQSLYLRIIRKQLQIKPVSSAADKKRAHQTSTIDIVRAHASNHALRHSSLCQPRADIVAS